MFHARLVNTMDDMKTLGLRQQPPAGSIRALRDRLAKTLPSRWLPTEEYLRQIENGKVDLDVVNPIVLQALAEEYGMPLSELCVSAYGDLRAVAGLIARID